MEENTYLAERIKNILFEMSSIKATLEHRSIIADFRDETDDWSDFDIQSSEYEDDFKEYAEAVYKLILSYVEEKKQPIYLAEIRETLKPLLALDKINEELYYPSSGTTQNMFLHETRGFLNAYPVFGEKNLEHLMQRTGITYLETILHNTAVVIHHRNLQPKNETDVYKAVADICKAVFPKSSKPDSVFIKSAGEYKPDLLIPALNCAVEYKYATTEVKLKSTIEGILGDVQNYSDHPVYKLFYAVFYVKPDIWGVQKFKEVWKENNFPPNWKWVYVVG